jgi:type I site-specific restriction endonuclease
LAEGFDEPSIDCVIPLRPTKIRSLFSQQIGRGTRVHLGKDHLLVLDFLWISRRHSIAGAADLVAADEEEAQEIKAQLRKGANCDLLGAMSAATAERLRKLAEKLEENRRRRSEDIDLLELATTLGDPDLASWEPTMRWHSDAPTQGQLDALEKFGVTARIRSKGHASALLGQLIERSNRGLASYKQIRLLRKFDIPNPHLLSLAQASKTIGELIRRKSFSYR